MTRVVLGVHSSVQPNGRFTADGNAALVVDGHPAFAIAQERVSRQKYDGGFADAARYTLDSAGLSIADVDTVAISTFGRPDVLGGAELAEVRERVRLALGDGPEYQVSPSHHLVHALSAVTQCGYSRALVAVIDNEGSILGHRRFPDLWRHNLERTSYYLLEDDEIRLVARDHGDEAEVGYGKAYSKVTRYVGFRSYQESGKTMALAAFGDRERFQGLRLFEEDINGRPRTTLVNTEDGLRDLAHFFARAGISLPAGRHSGDRLDPWHIDLAAWCQAELEDSVSARIRGLAAHYGVNAVCGAGGVFLNSVMNRRIQEVLDCGDVFVPPSPGDQGLALGAAAWWLWTSTGRIPRWTAQPYLGGHFDEPAIRTALIGHDELSFEEVDDPVSEAARHLATGGVVGWFQGRSEYGPRALGNRSILADPGGPWTREILNNLVKHREWFRPYAPVAREQDANSIFRMRAAVPFMMHVAPVRAEMINRLPGGLHVDHSARLQTVSAAQNSHLHELIAAFFRISGTPALLNTSLNVDGMPIVETPTDAIECFRRAPGMDVIFIGKAKVSRRRDSVMETDPPASVPHSEGLEH